MSLTKDPKGQPRKWWLISVATWGQFTCFASAEEAEIQRCNMAQSEQSVTHKVEVPKWVADMIKATRDSEIDARVKLEKMRHPLVHTLRLRPPKLDSSMEPQDQVKLAHSQEQALKALQAAGSVGLTTTEGIAAAGTRFPARAWELSKLGYKINKARVLGNRLLWRYTLEGGPK